MLCFVSTCHTEPFSLKASPMYCMRSPAPPAAALPHPASRSASKAKSAHDEGVVISLGHKAHVATCHTATGFCVVGEEARGRRRREGFLVSAVLVFIRTDYL